MAKIPRKTAVIFGGNAGAVPGGIGVFGSLAGGIPVESTDIAVIQAAGAWANGWGSALVDLFPAQEDLNAVPYVNSTQIAYLLQQGIAEYDASTVYYTNSFCSYNGQVYISLIDTNTGNTPNSSPSDWSLFIGSKVSLSPTAIAADTNNYNPTGFNPSVNLINISATQPYNVSGLANNLSSGSVIEIYNNGSFPIMLLNNSSLSTASNRFVLPNNQSFLLRPGFSITLIYTGSNWLVQAFQDLNMAAPQRGRVWTCLGNAQGLLNVGILFNTLVGTGATISNGTDTDGVATKLNTDTTTNHLAEITNNTAGTPADYADNFIEDNLELFFRFKMGTIASNSLFIGYMDEYGPDANNNLGLGVFEGSKGIALSVINGGNFKLGTSDGTETLTDSGVASDTSVHTCRIVFNTGVVTMWLDDTRVSSTSHLPAANTNAKPVIQVKTSTTASKTLSLYTGYGYQPK